MLLKRFLQSYTPLILRYWFFTPKCVSYREYIKLKSKHIFIKKLYQTGVPSGNSLSKRPHKHLSLIVLTASSFSTNLDGKTSSILISGHCLNIRELIFDLVFDNHQLSLLLSLIASLRLKKSRKNKKKRLEITIR